jgi:hypothetical protein
MTCLRLNAIQFEVSMELIEIKSITEIQVFLKKEAENLRNGRSESYEQRRPLRISIHTSTFYTT